jgi:hypothetical protein
MPVGRCDIRDDPQVMAVVDPYELERSIPIEDTEDEVSEPMTGIELLRFVKQMSRFIQQGEQILFRNIMAWQGGIGRFASTPRNASAQEDE